MWMQELHYTFEFLYGATSRDTIVQGQRNVNALLGTRTENVCARGEQLYLQLAATSSILMFRLCPRHFALLRTPSTRITFLFPLCVSGRCGHGSPCEQLCYELHDGMYECDCRDGYILHKNGYSCAGECVSRFDPYPALQFAFMAGDIFDFPNKISHRAAPGETF